jgi:Uma2 family endonuclease
MPLAPDLAVEVVSPSDRRGEVERKVATWLDAGTKLIWVVWIDKDLVTVHRPGEGVRELFLDDAIDGGEVLPGFSQQVRAFFE